MFYYIGIAKLFSRLAVLFCFLTNNVCAFQLLHISPVLGIVRLICIAFVLAILIGMERYLIVVLICIYLMTSE